MSAKAELGQALIDAIKADDPEAVCDAIAACGAYDEEEDKEEGDGEDDKPMGGKGPAALVLDIGPSKKGKE